MRPGPHINYKTLRRINPEAARRAVLEYLESYEHNIAQTARTFGITRRVVYNILTKEQEGNLKDRSKAPIHQPRKTKESVEDQVIAVKNKTRLGPKRLSIYLDKHQNLKLSWATIRNILRRNRH